MTAPQNFSGQKLRGRSFKRQNLQGADFRKADLRGANFEEADLTGANFAGAKAGVQKRWRAVQLVGVLVMSALSGFLTSSPSVIAVSAFLADESLVWRLAFAIPTAIAFAATIWAIARQGFTTKALNTIIVALVVTVVVAVTVAGTGAVASSVAFLVLGSIAGAIAIAGAVTAAVTVAGAVVGATAIAGAVAVAITVAVTGVRIIAVAMVGVVAVKVAVIGAVAVIAAIVLFSFYTAWRSIKGDEKFAIVRQFAVTFASLGGTRFYNATLTDADFTHATLKSANFRNANLTRTNFRNADKLERSRVGETILKQPAVRELLVTGNGNGKTYQNADLHGANLDGADLRNANLKHADLSHATFRQAHLNHANLTETLAIETNFARACLTGACLEAWNIDSTTKLEDVDCQYVFLLEEENDKGSRERRPHDPDKTFEPGDFEKLYTEIAYTVQLLLRNGVNPEAFRAAFQKIMDENPDITPNSIRSVEKKGANDVLVTVEVPEHTDKAAVEQRFDEVYQARLELEAEKNAALLEAERQHLRDIKEMFGLALVHPTSTHITATAIGGKAMTHSSDSSRKVEIGSMQGDITGNVVLGDSANISGVVTKTLNELPASPNPEEPGVKELLEQLQAAIEAEDSLSDEDKSEALEQVKTLAEVGKKPEDGALKKAGKTAMKILKGTIIGLPTAAKLAEVCQKHLPTLAQLLGL